jgi:predicted extracellular nuclease
MSSAVRSVAAASLTAVCLGAHANVQITEWMYTGNGGEFIEFTNLGATAVDFTGWVYDDESRFNTVAAGGFSLSGFGVVAPGESVILTESSAAGFRSAWSLPAGVKVVGGYTNNLGRNDEINLFDAGGTLVDRLRYGDSSYVPGTIRTQNISGTPGALADLAPFAVTTGWVLSASGDAFGSYLSGSGDIGNPGLFALAIPEPASLAMALAGLALVGSRVRARAGSGR